MLKSVLAATLVFGSILVVTPAFALSPHDAAVKCENTPGCYIDYLDDGTLVILGPEGGVVYCPAPADHKPCFVHSSKSKPRKAAQRMLQILEAAPNLIVNAPPKKKPAMVFNMGNGAPMGQGGRPVKSDGGGKSVMPKHVIHLSPSPVG